MKPIEEVNNLLYARLKPFNEFVGTTIDGPLHHRYLMVFISSETERIFQNIPSTFMGYQVKWSVSGEFYGL